MKKKLSVIIAIVVALAVIVTVFAVLRGRGGDEPPITPASGSASIPVDLPSEQVEPDQKPVASAPPERITIEKLGIDAAVLPYTTDDAANAVDNLTGDKCLEGTVIICVNPPTLMDAYWLEQGVGEMPYGSMPGTDATGNVYLSGHASASKEAVFTRLHELAAGDVVDVTNANGTVHYTVEQVISTDKAEQPELDEVSEQVPGRLLLQTCDYSDDAPVDGNVSLNNITVVAQMQSVLF
jgi:LPXTG-site transpeptidase (sortase) family protein